MTPSPRKTTSSKEVDGDKSPTALFISLALDMSWKLALVVLLPIIAGSLLSSHYQSSWFLLIGIVLAFSMAIAVIYQSYMLANSSENTKKGSK